jgi:hypothetical protein
VITCLSILAEPFIKSLKEKVIAKLGEYALKACNVRYLIALGVNKVFSGLLPDIANGILGTLHDLTPEALGRLRNIFAEKVEKEDLPDPENIVDDECIGIDIGFSLFKGFKTSKAEKGTLGEKTSTKDILKLLKDADGVGAEKTEGLEKLMQKMGIPDQTPMSGSTLDALQAALKNVEAKDINDRAEGKTSEVTNEKLKPLTKELDKLAKGAKVVPEPGPSQSASPVKGRQAPGRAPAPEKPAAPSKVWTPARMGIGFSEGRGKGIMEVKVIYVESRERSDRLSRDKPVFHICAEKGHFLGVVTFWVDSSEVPRPEPFRRPKVAIEWKIAGKVNPFRDDNPKYQQPWLLASFGPPVRVDGIEHIFELDVKDKDVVEMKFTLLDEDTQTPLKYEDRLPVQQINCQ